jgi:hypothetical protein
VNLKFQTAVPPSFTADPPDEMSRLFLPPVNRSMRTLDRTFFRKTVMVSAARIFEPRNIGRVRKECAGDLLRVKKVELMPKDPEGKVMKLLLLRPQISCDGGCIFRERGETALMMG